MVIPELVVNGSPLQQQESDGIIVGVVGPKTIVVGGDRLEKKNGNNNNLYYSINEEPSWHVTILLGIQHYLTMIGATISGPIIITPLMCLQDDDPDKGNIISTIIFVSGIITLLQSTFGTRLPIVQGGSAAFLISTIAIITQTPCPSPQELDQMNATERTEIWQLRMREVQGAIIVSALFEIAFGFFGLVGIVLKWITPLTVACAISSIGFSLFTVAADYASTNWMISMLTTLLIIIFSQYLKDVKIPLPFTSKVHPDGVTRWKRYPLFLTFPLLLAVGISWILCYILTATNMLSEGNLARTDVNSKIIGEAAWIRVPYPFQWGVPVITAGAVFGMLSSVITSTVESIGDYYSCAKISGAPRPPTHAINRGIFIEGLGCVLAGIWGTGNGTTSYSENIGAISVTRVGSRRIIQVAAILMIINGLVCKMGAIFVTIPQPIIGGVFCIVFPTVAGVGLSNLHGVDLNSPRNIFILGFSVFFGLTISRWMAANPTSIQLGYEALDQTITIILSTGMFIAGILAFILDNTIAGTSKERGLDEWNAHLHIQDVDAADGTDISSPEDKTYELPFGITNILKKFTFLKWLPISPTYQRSLSTKLPKTQNNNSARYQQASLKSDINNQC